MKTKLKDLNTTIKQAMDEMLYNHDQVLMPIPLKNLMTYIGADFRDSDINLLIKKIKNSTSLL